MQPFTLGSRANYSRHCFTACTCASPARAGVCAARDVFKQVYSSSQFSSKLSTKATTLQQPHGSETLQQESHKSHEAFSWTKQWYPILAVKDLDATRPHAEMLLGHKLVVWRDKKQQWHCFEDACPHTMVPLSEGRIEESDGSLMCGYHGWTFGSDGRVLNIPQMRKDKQAVATSNSRACATVRPTQVQQGLLFVWGESGPDASTQSAATPVPISDYVNKIGEDYVPLYDQYIRDLPGGFESWILNMQDQSHVAFAHHGVTGSRGGEKEGSFEMLEMETYPELPQEAGAALKTKFSWTANGKAFSKGTSLYYKPPCLLSFWVANESLSLYIYAVPVSVNCTRLIINAGGPFKQKPLIKILRGVPFFANVLRVLPHIQLSKVNDGDIIFLSGQHRAIGRTASQPADTKFFLPSDSDRGSNLWLQWLQSRGGGGPTYPPEPTGLISGSFWDNSGKLKRTEVLNRFTQHTSKCAACSKAFTQVQAAQKAATAVLGAMFLTAAAFLGQGYLPWSMPLLATAAAGLLLGYLLLKLRKFERELVFTDWVQADLH